MEKELKIKKCNLCGTVVNVLGNSKNEIICCGEQMKELVPNSVDAAIEKHVPTYEKDGNKIHVTVNHVMEDEHYIEWICLVTENKQCMTKFAPGQKAEASFCYIPGSVLYAYCNKHGLWKAEVE